MWGLVKENTVGVSVGSELSLSCDAEMQLGDWEEFI